MRKPASLENWMGPCLRRDDVKRDFYPVLSGSYPELTLKKQSSPTVDQLEDAGVVGTFVGSKAHEVLVADDLELDEFFKARELG